MMWTNGNEISGCIILPVNASIHGSTHGTSLQSGNLNEDGDASRLFYDTDTNSVAMQATWHYTHHFSHGWIGCCRLIQSPFKSRKKGWGIVSALTKGHYR